MKNFMKDIDHVLANENGGPNVEQVMGIAVALSVGVGLFLFGRSVYNWFNGSAGNTVSSIETPDGSTFSTKDW